MYILYNVVYTCVYFNLSGLIQHMFFHKLLFHTQQYGMDISSCHKDVFTHLYHQFK